LPAMKLSMPITSWPSASKRFMYDYPETRRRRRRDRV
jgi:hypothetical protein